MDDTEIIDGHCHVSSTDFFPEEFLKGVSYNILEKMSAIKTISYEDEKKVFDLMKSQHQDHLADKLIDEMDKAGIKKTVLLAPDFSYVMNTKTSVREMSDRHFAITQRHKGRFVVFLGVDPRWGEQGISEFVRGVEKHNIKGLKLYPPCGFSPSDKSLYPLYDYCEQKKLPVLLHTGPTSPVLSFKYTSPSEIDQAALKFPRVKFILAHGGVVNIKESAYLCAYRPNVYLDFAGFPTSFHREGWQGSLKELFSFKINHKIIFGTDWPVHKFQGGLRSIIKQLKAENGPLSVLSQHEIKKIMSENIRRLVDFSG